MKYQAKDRFRLAWHWLPLEMTILVLSCAIGFGLATWLAKPVYHARLNIRIQRQLSSDMSDQQRQVQLRKDVKNVGQFSVMPHQSGVLYDASGYTYSHHGIWESVQDLSESVSAEALDNQPVLQVTVASSSARAAQQNLAAFRYAIHRAVKPLKHYRITMTNQPTLRVANVMRKPVLKVAPVVGLVLAVLAPYLIEYVRGRGRSGND